MPLALILIAGVLLYSYANQAKAVYEQVQYSPQKLKIVKWAIFNTQIDLYFGIDNNTTAAASVQAIDGLLKTKEGVTLGTFVTRNQFTIAPQATTNVVARLSLNNYDALKALIDIIKSGKTPEIIFDGAITTNLLGRIPFKYTAFLSQDLSFKNVLPVKKDGVNGIGAAPQILEWVNSYNGGAYVTTNLKFEGRGIRQAGDGSTHARGLNTYHMTEAAFNRLKKAGFKFKYINDPWR